MKRIIAFDGIDCIGKSYVIHFLQDELIRNDYIPYVFHLSGPNKEYDEFFKPELFGKLPRDITDSLIQWEKFIQLYSDIKNILCASTRNVVLLDRTPYSENIWNMFFGRKNKFENDDILLHFLKMFELLNEDIQFINLEVDNKVITQRILLRDEDYFNYIKAYDRLFNNHHKPHKHHDHKPPHFYPHYEHFCKPPFYDNIYSEFEHFRPDENAAGKIMFMVNFLKEEFSKLFILLRKHNIDVITFENNNERSIEEIVKTILKELFNY